MKIFGNGMASRVAATAGDDFDQAAATTGEELYGHGNELHPQI
jgi:hypothetical protein